MTRRPRESQFIAIVHDDDSLSIMEFVVVDSLGPLQLATAENVEATIAKMLREQPELRPVTRWRFIDRGDIPADRTTRSRWRDTGTAIVVR